MNRMLEHDARASVLAAWRRPAHAYATDGRTHGLTQMNLSQMDMSPNATHAGGLKELTNLIKIDERCWVYHCMCSHGSTIYVGIASDVDRRISQHRSGKEWWGDVDSIIADRYLNRRQALEVEAHYIKHGNRTHMHNQSGRGKDPKAPHRWEIRRDWSHVGGGHFKMRDYYVTAWPDSRMVFPHDDDYLSGLAS